MLLKDNALSRLCHYFKMNICDWIIPSNTHLWYDPLCKNGQCPLTYLLHLTPILFFKNSYNGAGEDILMICLCNRLTLNCLCWSGLQSESNIWLLTAFVLWKLSKQTKEPRKGVNCKHYRTWRKSCRKGIITLLCQIINGACRNSIFFILSTWKYTDSHSYYT